MEYKIECGRRFRVDYFHVLFSIAARLRSSQNKKLIKLQSQRTILVSASPLFTSIYELTLCSVFVYCIVYTYQSGLIYEQRTRNEYDFIYLVFRHTWRARAADYTLPSPSLTHSQPVV